MSIAEKLVTIAENEKRVYDAGFEAGKAAGGGTIEDYMLEHIHSHNAQSNYLYAFAGVGWTSETYKPPITDKYGAKVIIDANVNASNMYSYSRVTDTIVPIDVSRAINNVKNAFQNAPNLVTINKLIVSETVPAMQFQGCSKLENIIIEGTIGTDFNFSGAPKLTHESLMSIINGLKRYIISCSDSGYGVDGNYSKDYSMTTFEVDGGLFISSKRFYLQYVENNETLLISVDRTVVDISDEEIEEIKAFYIDAEGNLTMTLSSAQEVRTLTLGSTNLAKLTDSEKAIATGKGWELK